MSASRSPGFELDHPAEIQAILDRLVRERTLTTVEFGDGLAIVSRVLGVRRGANALVFDVARDAAANDALLASRTLAFVTELDRIPIAFETGPPRAIAMRDGPAAAVDLPSSITRLQRREWFRAELPVNPPVRCTVLDDRGNASPAQAVDLSGGGAAVIVDDGLPVEPGRDHELILSLPEIGPVALDATLRTVRRAGAPGDAAAAKLRLGFRFESTPPRTVGQILRYVQRLEVDALRILKRRDG